MVSPILIAAIVLLALFKAYKYMVYKPQSFPPGPPRIPIFGTYLFLAMINYNFLHKAAIKFSEWYKSAIIGFYVGPLPTVAVHDETLIKAVLNNQDFEGRPDLFVSRLREPKYRRAGIFFNDGNQLIESRRFILRYLRDNGFGRRFEELESVIQEDIHDLMDMLKNGPKFEHEKKYVRKGEIMGPHIFGPIVTNAFIHIMCNERYTREEQSALFDFGDASFESVRNGDDYGKVLSYVPWIRHIAPKLSGYTPLRESSMYIHDFSEKLVQRYMKTYDPDYQRNFMDKMIKEMKEDINKDDPNSVFDYNHCVMSIMDFLIPPSSTVSSQLGFLFNWFVAQPEIYQKMQKEIDEVVGSGRLPHLDDRINMPYCEATLREVLRMDTVVPSSVPHTAQCDTELAGYKIPKGTVILLGLHALNSSKKVWGDPENFRPERFLNEKGQLDLSKDVSLPFSSGRRNCAGETFSRNIMFLIATAICQNFNVFVPKGGKVPDTKNHHLPGGIITSKDYWIGVSPR